MGSCLKDSYLDSFITVSTIVDTGEDCNWEEHCIEGVDTTNPYFTVHMSCSFHYLLDRAISPNLNCTSISLSFDHIHLHCLSILWVSFCSHKASVLPPGSLLLFRFSTH